MKRKAVTLFILLLSTATSFAADGSKISGDYGTAAPYCGFEAQSWGRTVILISGYNHVRKQRCKINGSVMVFDCPEKGDYCYLDRGKSAPGKSFKIWPLPNGDFIGMNPVTNSRSLYTRKK